MGIPLNQPFSADFPKKKTFLGYFHLWKAPFAYLYPLRPGDFPLSFQAWGQQRIEGVERGDALRDRVVGIADAHDLTPWRSTASVVLHVNQ